MMVWRGDWQLWDLNLKMLAWGGLSYYFTEEQMQELLVSFGPLRGSDLIKDRDAGNSEGYGFYVYQDPPVSDVALIYRTGILATPWLLLLEELYIYGMPHMISTSKFVRAWRRKWLYHKYHLGSWRKIYCYQLEWLWCSAMRHNSQSPAESSKKWPPIKGGPLVWNTHVLTTEEVGVD